MRTCVWLTLIPLVAWGQLGSDVIEVTATGPAAASTRYCLMLSLSSSTVRSVEEAAEMVAPAGMGANDLAGVTDSYQDSFAPDWQFVQTVRQSDLNSRLSALAKLAASLPAEVFIVYTAVALREEECDAAKLLVEARKRAVEIAMAAGIRVGPIESLDLSRRGLNPPTVGYALSGFAAILSLPRSFSPLPSASAVSDFCTLTVEFRLLR